MFPQVTSLIHPKEYLAGLHELGCEEGRKQVPRTCSPSLNSHKWHVYSSCTIRMYCMNITVIHVVIRM